MLVWQWLQATDDDGNAGDDVISQTDSAIKDGSDWSMADAKEFTDDSSSSSSDDEHAHVAPEDFIYGIKTLTPDLQQQLEQDMHQYVNYHGKKSFQNVLNLDILGDNGLARYAFSSSKVHS